MERNDILGKLEVVFREVFDDKNISINEEMNSVNIADWNSLNHMILISEVEKVFSIKFKLKDLNKMDKIGDMMDIISQKSSEK